MNPLEKLTKLGVVFIALFGAELAFGEDYKVGKVLYVGEHANRAEGIEQLLESAIAKAGHSAGKDAKVMLRAKAIETGKGLVLTLDKVKDDKVVFADSLKLKSFDEIDVALDRLTQAVIAERSVDGTMGVGKVMQTEEGLSQNRRKSERRWYFGFGPALSSGLETQSNLINMQLGYSWDLPEALFKIYYNAYTSTNSGDAFMGGLGIGGNYYLSNSDNAPFVHGGMAWGSARNNDDQSKRGFLFNGGVGMMFFRTSDVSVETALDVSTLAENIDGKTPIVGGVRVGLYW